MKKIVLFITLVVLIFLLIYRSSFTKQSQNDELIISPNLVPITQQPDITGKTYQNPEFGISFVLPEGYEVIQESENEIQLGFTNKGNKPFPYLTISKTQFTLYESYPPCSINIGKTYPTGSYPCLSNIAAGGYLKKDPITSINISNKEAESLYLIYGTDSVYQIVKIKSPPIEFKMFVAGGGLDETFKNLLSTVVFLN